MRYLCTREFFHEWEDSNAARCIPLDCVPAVVVFPLRIELKDCPDHSFPAESAGPEENNLPGELREGA